MKIEGSKILVTGASSGIGAALAPILAERGATVGIVARRADRLEEVLERCRKHTPESRMWAADLGDLARAEQVALEAWDAFGGLDVLVNNAAIPKRTHVSPISRPPTCEHVMDVDFHSPVRMTLAVLPRMLERGSRADRVRVEHGRPHPDRERVGVQRGEVRDVRIRGGDAASTSRARGVEVKLVLPGPIDTEIWDQPDNEPALIDVEKVPAAECAAGIADAIEDDGFEYYVPPVFPGGIDAKAIAVGKTAALRPVPPRHGRLRPGAARAERVVNEVRDDKRAVCATRSSSTARSPASCSTTCAAGGSSSCTPRSTRRTAVEASRRMLVSGALDDVTRAARSHAAAAVRRDRRRRRRSSARHRERDRVESRTMLASPSRDEPLGACRPAAELAARDGDRVDGATPIGRRRPARHAARDPGRPRHRRRQQRRRREHRPSARSTTSDRDAAALTDDRRSVAPGVAPM